mmetsp:Transcript_7477/g.23905  ORF Transcript_7477/g.23905 Transcript_7477/m.23905 type:complete len:292 (+) Transcript_7477:1060-1935(+)
MATGLPSRASSAAYTLPLAPSPHNTRLVYRLFGSPDDTSDSNVGAASSAARAAAAASLAASSSAIGSDESVAGRGVKPVGSAGAAGWPVGGAGVGRDVAAGGGTPPGARDATGGARTGTVRPGGVRPAGGSGRAGEDGAEPPLPSLPRPGTPAGEEGGPRDANASARPGGPRRPAAGELPPPPPPPAPRPARAGGCMTEDGLPAGEPPLLAPPRRAGRPRPRPGPAPRPRLPTGGMPRPRAAPTPRPPPRPLAATAAAMPACDAPRVAPLLWPAAAVLVGARAAGGVYGST